MLRNNEHFVFLHTHLFSNTTKVNRVKRGVLRLIIEVPHPMQTRNLERRPLTSGLCVHFQIMFAKNNNSVKFGDDRELATFPTLPNLVSVENDAFACMLGGEDGRTLFLATAGSSHPDECIEQRSGRIEILQVDVPHAGLP